MLLASELRFYSCTKQISSYTYATQAVISIQYLKVFRTCYEMLPLARLIIIFT